jgi:hypothetical protein
VSLSGSSAVDLEVAIELARKAFRQLPGTVVYVDREPRPAGTVAVGGDEVRVERPALVAFRDEMPGANWMHPCTYALVDIETGDVVATSASDRPPHFGLLPSSWVVAADPEGRADLVPPPPANDLQGGGT